MGAEDILGLKEPWTSEDLKKAYRVAAGKAHPDRPGGSDEQFHRVSEAYRILSERAAKAKCPKCKGEGKLRRAVGFTVSISKCLSCGGSGRARG